MVRMTPAEFEAYEAKCVRTFRDEDSGKVPFEEISHTFPPYVRLPKASDEVVAVMIPNVPIKKRRGSAKPTSS